jgi:hypothetical protein
LYALLVQVGSQTPIYAINSEHSSLRERNEQQRRRVDDVLTERLQLEQKTKQVLALKQRFKLLAVQKRDINI